MRRLFAVAGVAAVLCSAPAGSASDTSIILKRRHIFSAEPPPPPAPVKSILKPVAPAPLESLIEVCGIVYFPSGGSRAVVRRVKTGEDAVYEEGDTVERAEIVKIGPETVTFRYEGKDVELNLERQVTPSGGSLGWMAPSSPSPASPAVSVSSAPASGGAARGTPMAVRFRPTIEALMADKELQRTVSVLPSIADGKVQGFRVDNIPENSIPYQYGLRNGDIIHRVNGVLIDSLARGMAVYREIEKSGTKTVTVDVIRGGQQITLTYQLE